MRALKARQLGLAHGQDLDLKNMQSLNIPEAEQSVRLAQETKFLDGYRGRLEKLAATARAAGIEPVFITQPMLWGAGVDPSTGVNLETVKIDDGKNGKLYWRMLEFYNDQTRILGREKGVAVIDMARAMPKDSKYFYDGIHLSKEGAVKFAELAGSELTKHFKTLNIK